jgi:hypothetical protein
MNGEQNHGSYPALAVEEFAPGAPDGITEWTMDPNQGTVQGPLDLGFFLDRTFRLVLKDDQVALLTEAGNLRSVYFGGTHLLEIGNDRGRIAPDCRLAFLDLGQVFKLSWSRMNPVVWGREHDQALIGKCSLRIIDAEKFYRTFLAGNRLWEPAFLQRLVEQVARGAVEALLTESGLEPRSVSFAELQARITRLHADDLTGPLEAFGLTCDNLAVYTAAPPIGESQERPVGAQLDSAPLR